MKITSLLKTLLTWRLLLLVVTILFVSATKSLVVFSNFDGIRYLNIAKEGYGTPHTFYSYSLFPLYPLLIKFFSPLFGYLFSGIFLSHLFALASFFVFQKLALIDYPKPVVFWATLLLLCFPGSFFLISVYSESLFLLLSLCAVYFARKKQYLPSAIIAFLACYTRPAGVFLWFALLIEYYLDHKNNIKKLFKIETLTLLVPPLGLIYYLNYLQVYTSSFLNFLPSIPTKFVFLHQVIFRYLKMLIFIDHQSPLFWVILTEFLLGFLAIYLLVVSYNKLRSSYWIYLFLSFFIPTLWGSFSGLLRFLLVAFPLFFIFGEIIERQHPYIQKLYFFVSSILLIVNFDLFLNGIFVG